MQILASLLAAIVPISFYLFFLWKFDRYEPEPVGIVIKHFLWGAIGAVILGIVVSSFFVTDSNFLFISDEVKSMFAVVIVAPIVEELAKGIFLFHSSKKDYFDDMTDGIVYGGAIGLGFGMTENFMYFLMYNDNFVNWLSIVIIRSMFSATMHAIATATLGAMIAKAKFTINKFQKYSLPIFGLFLAMIFHATWNYFVSGEFTYTLAVLFMIGLIIAFLLVYKHSLKLEKEIIIAELEEEIYKINFPREHLSIISTSKKFRRDWINNKIRKKYARLATTLAFRKYQAKNSTGIRKENYIADIEMYRKLLSEIIERHVV